MMLLLSSQQMLEMSAFWAVHTLQVAYAPPVNLYCIVNDALVLAMPNIQQTLLQFVNAVQLRLIHLLLDVTPYLVTDLIKVGAIRRPQIWRTKVGIDCPRNCTVSRARCPGALTC